MSDTIGKLSLRAYLPKDRDELRRICRETCSDEYLLSHENVLYTKYSDYYTESEAENIFVLADEDDRAQGYILCCADSRRYARLWRREYLKRLEGSGLYKLMSLHTLWETGHMARRGFPAHLHIDISPAYQRMGGGHALVGALKEHLREKGVAGVYLGCGRSNAAGNAFYRKCGFTLYKKGAFRNIFTMKTL